MQRDEDLKSTLDAISEPYRWPSECDAEVTYREVLL